MSITIIVNSTPIDFPSSAQSPNWAPALIEFAQNTAAALNGIVGPYDIAPQVMDIPNNENEHQVQTTASSLAFPTDSVRSANIRYSVYRTNTSNQTHAESGILTVVYNPNAALDQKWEIQRDFIGNVTPQGSSGNGLTTSGINFRIDDSGQVYYTVTSLDVAGYTGKLSFAAQALLQTS
jgi:hypothetical protein